METTSLVFSAVIVAGLGYFVILLFLRIRNNVIAGHSYRNAMVAEIEQLRISRMLSALGVSMGAYTHQQSAVDIHQQINNCKGCANTATCDDALSQDSVDPVTIDYCENADIMREMVSRNKEEAAP